MEVETLKRLAVMGAHGSQISLSSSVLATWLGTSPQTAARRLALLEEQGYLVRKVTSSGQRVRITEKGWQRLQVEYQEYRRVFEGERIAVVRGKVTAGLGEGQYYISREGYRIQFLQSLGFVPFPGTLNIKLDEPFVPLSWQAIKIEGFQDEGRTFGGCKCYKIRVRGIEAAIVRPERSSYPENLVEVIAPVSLREALGLVNGDEVKATLE
ncbi:Riboflavin kinase [uncultured archaeon]|nr:Riboflavin kinase [uncultured archaeon]